MDQDERPAAPAVSRGQNVLYVLPHDWAAIPTFLTPALDRLDRDRAETQLLVVTPDHETALAVAEAAHELQVAPGTLVPVTSTRRLARLARERAPLAVAGPAEALAELLGAAALKLGATRTVVLAWVDEVVAAGAGPALETVLAEVPKEAARVLVAAEVTPAVDELVERYARRARREVRTPSAEGAELPARIGYLTVGATTRPVALRRLLDAVDPASAAVVATTPRAADEARRAVAALGYAPDGAVRVVERPGEPVDLVVLFDLPADPAVLAAAAAARPAHVVALVQPRQLPALRRLATGSRVLPLSLSDALAKASSREERLRDAVRRELGEGVPAREMLALEPLLDDHDPLEVAGALLRLLDVSRRTRRPEVPMEAVPAAAVPADVPVERAVTPRPEREERRERRTRGGEGAEAGGRVRVYLSVGSMDGASPGDVLGAIANESGLSRDQVGRIEMRDTHTLVEVDAARAERVVDRMNGVVVRGRRLTARLDRPRLQRGDRPERGMRERGERGGFRAARDDRPARGERRGGGRFDERPRRGGREERDASYGRTLRDEQSEWAERAERIRRARRPRPDERE